MTAGVYQLLCSQNNVSYIGESCDVEHRIESEHIRMLRSGKHHNVFLQRAWNKYGEDSFTIRVLWSAPDESVLLLSDQQLSMLTRSMEAYIGQSMLGEGFMLFNIRDFDRWGVSSPMMTPSIRKKAAASIRGANTREKISAAAKAARNDPVKAANIYNAVHSPEARAKRSASLKAAWAKEKSERQRWSESQRLAQSARMRAAFSTAEMKTKLLESAQKRARKVFCVETGITYPSLLQAAKSVQVSTAALRYALDHNTKSRGCHWQFV